MSDATGTVVASVVSLVSAVIVAVVAGVYAKRGAEAGGRKAVEAALAQVQGAAAAEHWQWVRTQRHAAYVGLLAAYSALDEVVGSTALEVRGGTALDAAAGDELRARLLELQDKTSQLALWKPNDAYVLAHKLFDGSKETLNALLHASREGETGPGPAWSRFFAAKAEMNRAYVTFLQRAGEVIRDPQQPVS
ncbi:hypothetical protein [Streptomyces sp. NPDC051684]|uniref:hypothetical protein n=1 Tax=Streptomyces sp. NPDC051684 TaxID=3365670 RepID=UPI00379DFEEB